MPQRYHIGKAVVAHLLQPQPKRLPRGHNSRCTVAMPSDLDCLVLAFHDEESPTAGTARPCGPHLQVLLHKQAHRCVGSVAIKLTFFLCLDATAEKLAKVVFLFWWYLGAAQRFDGGLTVKACCGFDASHVATYGSCFLPCCKTQSLPDFMNLPAFRSSSSHRSGRHSLAKSPGVCQCHSIQRRILCVTATVSITHRSTIRIAVPDTFELSEGLWSLLCHASQLPQIWYGKDPQSAFWRRASAKNSRHPLLRFVRHRAATTAV